MVKPVQAPDRSGNRSRVPVARAALPATRPGGGIHVTKGGHAGTHLFEGGPAHSLTEGAPRASVETLLLVSGMCKSTACAIRPGNRA